VSGDRFTVLGEQYASSGMGTGLTLVPLVGIDDGNGGANYALTLVDNNAGQILPSLDLAGLGASNVTSRLNGDSGTTTNLTDVNPGSRSSDFASSTLEGCNRSDAASSVGSDGHGPSDNTRGHCAAGAEEIGLIQVVSTGIRLPARLTTGQDFR
jgi:hypothetical protein